MAKTNVSSDQKFMAAIGYLWILSVIVLAVKKNDRYVRFHASQGALLAMYPLGRLVLVYRPPRLDVISLES